MAGKKIEDKIPGKKRILYFVPDFPRLTETFIEREIAKLISLNHLDVKILSLHKASGYMSPNVEKAVTFKGLGIIDCIKSARYFFTNGKDILEMIKMGFSQGFGRGFKSLYLVLKSVGFVSVFKRFQPDHIHAHFLSDPSTIAMIVARILRVPYSISGHAKDVFVEGTLIPQKVNSAKFIAICNTYAWSRCVQLSGGVNSSNIHRIFHGMNLKSVLETPASKTKPNRPLILTVSRLVEKKGLTYLIDASKILMERGVNHEIHIVGPGPMFVELTEMIKELKLDNRVFIEGGGKGIPNAEVIEFLKIADIFALPSVETTEGDVDGVPTVVIEASMAKIPVVTTHAGGISDLITEETGLIVPERNPDALADALERLIFNDTLRRTIAEKAYEKATDIFDPDKNVGELERLLLL